MKACIFQDHVVIFQEIQEIYLTKSYTYEKSNSSCLSSDNVIRNDLSGKTCSHKEVLFL